MNPQPEDSGRSNRNAGSYRLDQRSVRSHFERAAGEYDRGARVARELGARLLEHLEPVRIEPERVLDLGAGTCDVARALSKRYRGARVAALDLAESMLIVARRKRRRLFSRLQYVCGDAEQLPLASECMDLVVSNAVLPWCNAPDRVFSEILRLLKPGGLLMFSTLGPDTLWELRQSFARVDERPHVHVFMDMHDVGDALVRAGFADVVMDSARLTAEYEGIADLRTELKVSGASNALVDRARGLGARSRLERLARAYEAHRRNGLLPATFEAVFAHAWKPRTRKSAGLSVAPPRL